MITAIVNFQLPQETTAEQARAAYQASAPKYQGVPGLVRKYYLFDPETKLAGGVYLWESRAQAEAFYDEAWMAFIAERYGVAPDIRYFETPVIVDNLLDVVVDAAE